MANETLDPHFRECRQLSIHLGFPAVKLLAEYAKHPINLQPTKAFSPASIGKSYLHGMGITPILERQSDFPEAYLGFAQTAFFGGRTSAHIRKVPVPVVYVDFLSMYPTVNSLMDLRRFLIAREVQVKRQCGATCLINAAGKVNFRSSLSPIPWTR